MKNKRQGKLDSFREERHGEQEERKASLLKLGPQNQAGTMLEICVQLPGRWRIFQNRKSRGSGKACLRFWLISKQEIERETEKPLTISETSEKQTGSAVLLCKQVLVKNLYIQEKNDFYLRAVIFDDPYRKTKARSALGISCLSSSQ